MPETPRTAPPPPSHDCIIPLVGSDNLQHASRSPVGLGVTKVEISVDPLRALENITPNSLAVSVATRESVAKGLDFLEMDPFLLASPVSLFVPLTTDRTIPFGDSPIELDCLALMEKGWVLLEPSESLSVPLTSDRTIPFGDSPIELDCLALMEKGLLKKFESPSASIANEHANLLDDIRDNLLHITVGLSDDDPQSLSGPAGFGSMDDVSLLSPPPPLSKSHSANEVLAPTNCRSGPPLQPNDRASISSPDSIFWTYSEDSDSSPIGQYFLSDNDSYSSPICTRVRSNKGAEPPLANTLPSYSSVQPPPPPTNDNKRSGLVLPRPPPNCTILDTTSLGASGNPPPPQRPHTASPASERERTIPDASGNVYPSSSPGDFILGWMERSLLPPRLHSQHWQHVGSPRGLPSRRSHSHQLIQSAERAPLMGGNQVVGSEILPQASALATSSSDSMEMDSVLLEPFESLSEPLASDRAIPIGGTDDHLSHLNIPVGLSVDNPHSSSALAGLGSMDDVSLSCQLRSTDAMRPGSSGPQLQPNARWSRQAVYDN
jgi:hypothetical protein